MRTSKPSASAAAVAEPAELARRSACAEQIGAEGQFAAFGCITGTVAL
jgi:hypothetical protein